MQDVRIVSFNVGLRGLGTLLDSFFEGRLENLLKKLDFPDILCIQEVKAKREDLTSTHLHASGYLTFLSLNTTSKSYYAGVATIVSDKIGCSNVEFGVFEGYKDGSRALDAEGRALITFHGSSFVVINIYAPAVSTEEQVVQGRLQFKAMFEDAVLQKVRSLSGTPLLVVAGDFNVAHKEVDHVDIGKWRKANPSIEFSQTPSRVWFDALLKEGLRDSLRMFVDPFEKRNTCWNQSSSARVTDYGSRIDYALVRASSADCQVVGADTMSQFPEWSDHCPISVTLRRMQAPEEQKEWLFSSANPHPLSEQANRENVRLQTSIDKFLRPVQKGAGGDERPADPLPQPAPRAPSSKRQRTLTSMVVAKAATPAPAEVISLLEDEEEEDGEGEMAAKTSNEPADSSPPVEKKAKTKSAASEAWSKLVLELPVPTCKCGIPMVKRERRADKTGFYACSKPASRAGDPNGSCGFFLDANAYAKRYKAMASSKQQGANNT
jgi:exodeoxyribonuclease III